MSTPSVLETVTGLIQAGQTVRVSMQAYRAPRVEGALLKVEPAQDGGISSVKMHYDSIILETTPPPVHFLLEELEHHSSLKKIDVGWLLTINHKPR